MTTSQLWFAAIFRLVKGLLGEWLKLEAESKATENVTFPNTLSTGGLFMVAATSYLE